MPLPYGTGHLDSKVVADKGPPKRIRCFVTGCIEFLRPPTQNGFDGDVCPTHGIRCHGSGTYSYEDASRNTIIDPDLFLRNIVGNPDKYESDRLGNENSEDALTWNVFRTFQSADCLSQIVNELLGIEVPGEPTLYLWGLRASDNSFEVWSLLHAARERFESNLPVKRPFTEPDIGLHLASRYLILIEAKFTSTNKFYVAGQQRKNERDPSLTLDELRSIYRDPSLRLLNFDAAQQRQRINYQLWRNTVFAEWMALQESADTKAYHVNLVRAGTDEESADEFHELISDDFKDRFQRVTWEDIYALASRNGPAFQRLCRYMEEKTASLRKAFLVP